jgi:CRISPR-associated protein Csm4
MKQAIILKCSPQSRFHFGRVAIDADTSLNDSSMMPHSDTLFSAMIHLSARLFETETEVNNFVELFGKDALEPKIRLSSGFYCLENAAGEFLYFLPKPLNFNLIKTDNHKDLKKIQFISKSVWEQGLKPADWVTKCKIIDKKFVVTNLEFDAFKLSEQDKFFKEISLPKVTVHKEDKKGTFFYQTTVQIMPLENGSKVHFYFLLETENLTDAENKALNQVLFLLPYEGIGGERTTGCGLFLGITKRAFNLQVADNQHFVCVSLVNPNSNEEFKSFQNYQIVTRGGRQIGQSDHQFLKKVNMIAEGAVVANAIRGRIVSIAPTGMTTPYLRNGISMTLPFPK